MPWGHPTGSLIYKHWHSQTPSKPCTKCCQKSTQSPAALRWVVAQCRPQQVQECRPLGAAWPCAAGLSKPRSVGLWEPSCRRSNKPCDCPWYAGKTYAFNRNVAACDRSTGWQSPTPQFKQRLGSCCCDSHVAVALHALVRTIHRSCM
jgi:hypothetical protein